jgi:hypothetical protein
VKKQTNHIYYDAPYAYKTKSCTFLIFFKYPNSDCSNRELCIEIETIPTERRFGRLSNPTIQHRNVFVDGPRTKKVYKAWNEPRVFQMSVKIGSGSRSTNSDSKSQRLTSTSTPTISTFRMGQLLIAWPGEILWRWQTTFDLQEAPNGAPKNQPTAPIDTTSSHQQNRRSLNFHAHHP